MTCSPGLIEAYLDGEIDDAELGELELHMASCPDCTKLRDRLREQKAAIRAEAPYYSAPPELQRSIHDALQRASTSQATPLVREIGWRRLAIAAAFFLAVSVSWNLLQLRPRDNANSIAADVLTGHIRSLIGTHLTDVESSDQHTVKPWFAGKLDFSPSVKDFQAEGFPLAGGRVEYLAGRRVAALVYRRRQHVINLFEWPAGASPGGPIQISRDGFNILHWTDGAMTYWAVSDVNAADLGQFQNLYRR